MRRHYSPSAALAAGYLSNMWYGRTHPPSPFMSPTLRTWRPVRKLISTIICTASALISKVPASLASGAHSHDPSAPISSSIPALLPDWKLSETLERSLWLGITRLVAAPSSSWVDLSFYLLPSHCGADVESILFAHTQVPTSSSGEARPFFLESFLPSRS